MVEEKLNVKPTFSWLLSNPIYLLGFGFGSGLAPKAPGTFGTIPALPITALLMYFGMNNLWLAILTIPLFIIGVWICDKTEQALGVHDYGGIVWDEIVAMLLVLAFTPNSWTWWLVAFLAFRFFDAVKPQPIKWFDSKVSGGFGVMLDDIIAAVFAILVVQLLVYLS